MAAYAALVSVMHILDDIQRHHSPPISLHQQLQSLTQLLTYLQEFLEAYKSPVADADDEADPLEMRIADAAYEAEDVIESHIVDNIHLQNQQTSSLASPSSCSVKRFRAPEKPENVDDEQVKSVNFYQDLQRVIEEMDSIKLAAMKKAVVVHDHQEVSASAAPLRSSSSSSSAMVCPDAVSRGLMEKLIGDQLGLQVIPIVGMGGIGKTTLAKNVYERQLIKCHFDVCAWATISQQYNTKELICEVLSQATNRNKEELTKKGEAELGLELYQNLYGRRFLIVLDDMWSIDAWENIQKFFPNCREGSRILVTTRLSQLSSQLKTNYTHQMEFLDEGSSWDLFSKTVFGERSCPPELMNIGMNIVDNCRGLPLSIVVVGGLLKKMEHNRRCWNSIRNNLTSVVSLEDDKHCLRLLRLSYNHLPVYLKPCFLYMGVFEEDDQIKVSTIIKLWVSEGFLKPMKDRSSEAIAMGFFKELVDRNLILIDDLGSTGNIKSCKIHDLLRDLCLNEVQKEGFYHVVGQPQGTNRPCRRIVIPRKTSKKKVLESLHSIPLVRSVICEYGNVPPCWNRGLLRTFHAYKYRKQRDRRYKNTLAFEYVNLRHLAVEVGSNSSFFSSLNLFWNLHTLIVSFPYYMPTAPAEIWKMPQFRHIEFLENWVCLPDPPSDVVILENLRILKGVKNFKCREEVVKRIPNVKKLSIQYYSKLKGTFHDDYYCVTNIQSLSKLESLFISCDKETRWAPYLHKLSFPDSLKSLTLHMDYELEWEAVLVKISSLPHLEKLKLWSGCFGIGKWKIVEGQFPKLKYLGLMGCRGLKQLAAEEDSSVLPRLQHLCLYEVVELKKICCEIGNIETLQKISMYECSESAVKSVKVIVKQQVELQGEPLPFHVEVYAMVRNKTLQSLTAPNFTVIAPPL